MTTPAISTETKIIVVCMFVALTAWYLVQHAGGGSVASGVTLLGIGVVLPTLLNEWRRRSASDDDIE